MKYFQNLPKQSFETTIGTFAVSNFFTYLDVSDTNLLTTNILVDKKSTLLEASHTVYQDPNSFWSLLSANKTINPFTLLKVNTELFQIEYKDKINLQLSGNTAGTTGYVFPVGSIIAPYTSNTGGSYSYSSVGNFNLYGPLSIIESVSYYDGNMIIKDQTGATYAFITSGGATASVVIMTKVAGGTYSIAKPYYTTNPKEATKTVVITTKPSEGKEEKSEEKTVYEKFEKAPVAIENGTEITLIQTVDTQNKNIKAYRPSELGSLINYFVTAKYT